MIRGENIYRDKNPQVFAEGNPQVSVVVPAYNEAGNLTKLYTELIKVLSTLNMSWEIVFVDDGSKDDTWSKIVSLCENDIRVKGVRLSRNFGHQNALLAGLVRAKGQAAISMDADLQHSPQIIPILVDEWRKGNKIVHTVRSDPNDLPFLKKVTSQLFYRIFSFLSGVKIDPGMADFRLLDRQVVDEIIHLKESRLFFRGLVQWVGYPSSRVEFQSGYRFSGDSKYNFHKMLKFAWTGITSFSVVPLRVTIILGLISSMFAFYRIIQALYTKLFTDSAVPGWTSLTIIVSFSFGILFIVLGIIGEYIARILEEVRSRPKFIVSERIGFEEAPREERTQGII